MSQEDLALICHLLGVVLFFGGSLVALVAFESARRRDRAGDVAVLLGLAPVAVAIVGIGLAVVLASGFWLLHATEHTLGDGWLLLALGLLVVSGLLGALGGRSPKRARLLAERSPADDPPSAELRRLLDDGVARGLNMASGVAALGVLVLVLELDPRLLVDVDSPEDIRTLAG
ncbi:MAG TPA: DUF2269 family protein [Gaiellaceae bacterium]|nr:DUF2269 family protein [Gaiellaceae bacterium]